MNRHGDLREFLARQSPAWLAERLVRAARHDRVLLAELRSAASGTDAVETARRDLTVPSSSPVSWRKRRAEPTSRASTGRWRCSPGSSTPDGHAAQAAGLAQHALQLMHESAESVNYEYELAECAGFAQELHRQACLAADVDRRALAEWLFDAAAKDDYGLFQSAVADYTQVLGEQGMERIATHRTIPAATKRGRAARSIRRSHGRIPWCAE